MKGYNQAVLYATKQIYRATSRDEFAGTELDTFLPRTIAFVYDLPVAKVTDDVYSKYNSMMRRGREYND